MDVDVGVGVDVDVEASRDHVSTRECTVEEGALVSIWEGTYPHWPGPWLCLVSESAW